MQQSERLLPPRLCVEDTRLIIERFETEDQDIVSYFNELKSEDLESRFQTALKVGVISLRTVGLTEKVDYIQKEFNLLNNRFTETVEKTMQALNEKFEEIFGEEGKVPRVLQEHFGEDGRIVKEVFDPMREGSPLYGVRVELQGELRRLGEQLGINKAVMEVKEKTPLKGHDFEDFCERILSKIVRHYGDILERASDRAGKVRHSKKGDCVVTLNSKDSMKIVFEVKDAGRFSVREILRILDEAMKNREASYGVFIVKNIESLPDSVGWFSEYNGNQLVCALSSEKFKTEELHEEIMFIAYRWAKTKIQLEAAREEKVDPIFIRDKVAALKSKLADLSAIRTQCGNIEQANETIRGLTRQIERDLNEQLDSILIPLER